MNITVDSYLRSLLADLILDTDLLPTVDIEIDQFDQWSNRQDATLSPTATSCVEAPLDIAA